jgi:hypothetical protein
LKLFNSQESSEEGCTSGKERYVLGLIPRPVIGTKGTSDGALTKCNEIVGHPQHTKQHVYLHDEQQTRKLNKSLYCCGIISTMTLLTYKGHFE